VGGGGPSVGLTPGGTGSRFQGLPYEQSGGGFQGSPTEPYKPGKPGQPPGPGGNGSDIYDRSSQWMNNSWKRMQEAMNYKPQSLSDVNMGKYMNPYTGQVIDKTMADMDRSRQMIQDQNGAAATAAGAFGGSRHGLVEAETNRGYADQVGQMSAGLRQSGYQNAQQAAMNDLARRDAQNGLVMQGAGGLAGLSGQAFGYGQQLNQNLSQQGAQQQQLMQQLINAGKGQWGGYIGAGDQGLQRILAMLGGSAYPTTQKTSQQPGFGDWASLIPGLLPQ